MPDSELVASTRNSRRREIQELADRVLIDDPSSGPYDEFIAQSYGRAVRTGRLILLACPVPFVTVLIAEPLLRRASQQLTPAEIGAVMASVTSSVAEYLDAVFRGQRLVGAPGATLMEVGHLNQPSSCTEVSSPSPPLTYSWQAPASTSGSRGLIATKSISQGR